MSEMWFKVMFPDKSTFRLISPLPGSDRERERERETETERERERKRETQRELRFIAR